MLGLLGIVLQRNIQYFSVETVLFVPSELFVWNPSNSLEFFPFQSVRKSHEITNTFCVFVLFFGGHVQCLASPW